MRFIIGPVSDRAISATHAGRRRRLVPHSEDIDMILNDGTAVATTTGALGVATVTLRNDFNDDGTEDFQGSLAFDVIAGDVGGVAISAGTPMSRFEDAEPEPAPDPTPEPLPEPIPEGESTTPDGTFPSPGEAGEGEAANPDEGFPTP